MDADIVKVTTEGFKFGTKALETGEKLGGFLGRVFGTAAEDVVGVIGGDWLRQVRIRNADKLAARTEEILKQRGIENKTEPMSPSVAIPLLEAAQDETREELCELWAKLLANGMDPERSGSIRRSIIAAVKQFEPLDAIVLEKLSDPSVQRSGGTRQRAVSELNNTYKDEFHVSFQNLQNLQCFMRDSSNMLTPFGREIIRACSK